MKLLNIAIHDFRNIEQASLCFSSGINFISGVNGVGKTSILEAIHHLSTGNSFKTRFAKKIIQFDKSNFIVRGELEGACYIAIQKKADKTILVRINNEKVDSSSQLARYLPVQIIFDDLFNIIDCGPSVRRCFLDWGLFHVEPPYNSILANYKKAVYQRNILLKKNNSHVSLYQPWENLIIEYGLQLHQLRVTYINKLLPEFEKVLKKFNEHLNIKIKYHHGWGQAVLNLEAEILKKELNASREKERELGYSNKGAHRADLIFYTDSHFAKGTLSRGQQKVALIALKIAQGNLLPKPCLYLIDDLAAELDANTLYKICSYLKKGGTQAVITTLESTNPILNNIADKWFNVSNGEVAVI